MGQFQRWQRAGSHRDWISTSVLTLLVAAAGAGVAIALTNDKSSGSTTFAASTTLSTVTIAPTTTTVVTTAATTPTTTATPTTTTAPRSTTVRTTTPAQPSGQVVWPHDRSGWSLFLVTYPVAGGKAAALASAKRAARSGLPQVGVLDSSGFGSLRPGYYVVFSGIYQSQAEAQSALPRAQAGGFGSAYPRNISP